MRRHAGLGLALALASAANGQTAQPPSPVPAQWPNGAAYGAQAGEASPYSYRAVFADPRLTALIDLALAHNQDVAAALANIEAARAQYHITRAGELPALDLGGSATHYGGPAAGRGSSPVGNVLDANASVPGYELDLFGRVHALAGADRARFLASEATARATRLTLVGDVADGWLAYGADASLLKIAQNTAAAARSSVALTHRRVAGGIAPLSDQRQAELTLHAAEGDVAAETTALAQDVNALRLLLGGEVPAEDLPDTMADAAAHIATVPAGQSSAVLLRRPDVATAELDLAADSFDVRAARAALFPRITLTGLAGFASQALIGMFTGGNFSWNAGAAVNWPLFNGGASKANVKLAQAHREAALAQYRQAIESAFRDVADALARAGTIDAQLAASHGETAAAADNDRLATRRYTGGIASYLDKLTADQALYAAQKAEVATELLAADNRVSLYRALGGDAPGEIAASPKP